MRRYIITLLSVFLLVSTLSCCGKDGNGDEDEKSEPIVANEREEEPPAYEHDKVHRNWVSEYWYHSRKPGSFAGTDDGNSAKVMWRGEEKAVIVLKDNEVILPIAVTDKGYYLGKTTDNSDSMNIKFFGFDGSTDELLTIPDLDLGDWSITGAAISSNGKYLIIPFQSGMLICADLERKEEINRYQEHYDAKMLAITDDGRIIIVYNHWATVAGISEVTIIDIHTGEETTIATGMSSCIGGADEPRVAFSAYTSLENAIEPYLDTEGGGNGLGPTITLYYPDIKGEPIPALTADASSTLIEDKAAPGMFAPGNACDGDLTTAWVEGADGNGVGESLTLKFPFPVPIESVTIFCGWGKSEASYKNNARPKKVRVETDTGLKTEARIPEADYLDEYDTGYSSAFVEKFYMESEEIVEEDSGAHYCSEITITILEVRPGKKFEDCAISEVSVFFSR